MAKKEKSAPAAPKESIESLEKKAEILHLNVTNLARSLGVFHGLNERLQGKRLTGRGAAATRTIMFDQIHLIAIRVAALVARPREPTDVTLKTFVNALQDHETRQLVIERAAGWYGPTMAERERKRMTDRVDRLPKRYADLYGEGGEKLRLLRNKVLTHVTTEADQIEPVVLRELWAMANRTVTLGSEIALIFKERATSYADEMRYTKDDAAYIIGFIRAADSEQNREIARLRRERRARYAKPEDPQR